MKVLIVDDEPGLAAGLAAWLRENGWENVGAATTSDEAIAWINQHGHLDVLVTDVFITPADGMALRESLQAHLPKMKTIFISGYDVSEHAPRMEGHPFLQKPVTGDDLDTAIRKLYEAPTPRVATATPKATPQAAAPQAVTPQAVAPQAVAPQAVVATPKAIPQAVTPQAVAPQAVVATPKAIPQAVTPQAVTPQAVVATPKATPQAVTPRAAATPQVAAVAPQAVNQQAATPRVASPRPVAPQAAAPRVAEAQAGTPRVASPQAKVPQTATPPKAKAARAASGPVAAAAATVGREVELPDDEMVGIVIGEYQIEARIGSSPQGAIYRALQTNMGRHVRFYTLDRELAADPTEIQRFISNASVKANVAHPSIFAVYEAGEKDGIYYYSCEYLPCRPLRQIREAGEVPDVNTALQVMKVVADVMTYFVRERITHNFLNDNAILLTKNNRPRIANIAVHQAAEEFSVADEMAQLGRVIIEVLPEEAQALGVRKLAESLASGEVTFPGWPALGKAVADLEPKVAPEDAYKLDAQERGAIRMVEEAKKRQKRGMIISSLVSLGLLAAALGSVWFFHLREKGAVARTFDRMIEVPGGPFVYQDGEKLNLPTFYIDEYEVTIGQYAEFLKYLEEHPDEAEKFNHSEQPKGKSHLPEKWATEELATGPMPGYYERAQRWAKYRDAPLDVNSPVFGVDWFDAYAYANWKGHRLPTEKEWEKAARGTAGYVFPWGDDDDPKLVNSGNDTDRNPKKGGEIDGWDAWAPVDEVKTDKSMFGVIGMAGNVSEWTSSRATDPQLPSQEVPVIRGGNWRTPKDYQLTRRVLKLTELQTDEALGFRTVSDPPPKGSSR